MPGEAVPIVHHEMGVASLGKYVDTLLRSVEIGDRGWRVDGRGPGAQPLVSPVPRRTVPIVHNQVTAACLGEHIDSLGTAQISNRIRSVDTRGSVGQALVGPMPGEAVPVVDHQVPVISLCEGVNPLLRAAKVSDGARIVYGRRSHRQA